MIFTINTARWNDNIDQTDDAIIKALEEGQVIYLPNLSFALEPQEQALLSPHTLMKGTKNISFNPATCSLKGTQLSQSQDNHLSKMMARYYDYSKSLLNAFFPHYQRQLHVGKTSYRPIEIKDRQVSIRKDDTRLHVDAFTSMPTQGKRILRVFSNINPAGKSRFWNLGEPFEKVLEQFSNTFKKPFPGARKLLNQLGVTKSYRTLYDHYMLQLHDNMKLNHAYQKKVAKCDFHFPAGSSWIVFTDSVSHAALSGQYVLEQTFYLSPNKMCYSEHAPLSILEHHFGEKLI